MHLKVASFTYQNRYPRFKAENLEKNKKIYEGLEGLARKHQCYVVQLALAWVLHQGNDVVPIPGEICLSNKPLFYERIQNKFKISAM